MISVIMPSYNKAEYLDYTLSSFLHQSDSDFEIIIVNDGGTDHTKELVERYVERLNIKYIYQDNQGRSAARNRAVQESSGELLLFNDDDRIVCPDFIESLKTYKSSNTVVIGEKWKVLTIWKKGVLFLTDDDYVTINKNFPEKVKELENKNSVRLVEVEGIANNFSIIEKLKLKLESANFTDVLAEYAPSNFAEFYYPWAIATTANLLVPKKAFQEIGGFDEGFIGWGVEDIEFSYRLYKSGLGFQFCERAKNYHQSHPNSLLTGTEQTPAYEQSLLRAAEQWRNTEYFCKKYNALEVYILIKGFKELKSLSDINNIYKSLQNLPDSIQAELLSLYKHFIESCRA